MRNVIGMVCLGLALGAGMAYGQSDGQVLKPGDIVYGDQGQKCTVGYPCDPIGPPGAIGDDDGKASEYAFPSWDAQGLQLLATCNGRPTKTDGSECPARADFKEYLNGVTLSRAGSVTGAQYVGVASKELDECRDNFKGKWDQLGWIRQAMEESHDPRLADIVKVWDDVFIIKSGLDGTDSAASKEWCEGYSMTSLDVFILINRLEGEGLPTTDKEYLAWIYARISKEIREVADRYLDPLDLSHYVHSSDEHSAYPMTIPATVPAYTNPPGYLDFTYRGLGDFPTRLTSPFPALPACPSPRPIYPQVGCTDQVLDRTPCTCTIGGNH